jgi:D-alanyl-D-alanine dipeptidase
VTGRLDISAGISRITSVLAQLSAHGLDAMSIRTAAGPEWIEIIQGQRTLIVLPPHGNAELPAARLMAEIAAFLLPDAEAALQPVSGSLKAGGVIDPLVDVASFDPSILIDSRYATTRNCAGRRLYPAKMQSHCFLRRTAAARLSEAQSALRREGYGLKIWDGYRPHAVQRLCADPRVIPDEATRLLFVPPSQGSNHGRGCAVDLTLVQAATGQECEMPTEFDSPLPQAVSGATDGLTREQLENRKRLQQAMRQAGFAELPHEWWHFNYRPDGDLANSRNAGDVYLVLDIPFEELLAA